MGELFLHELARAAGREFSSSLLTEAGAMPLPSHFKSRDQTNDLTRPHAILFYQMFVPSRSLWLLKKSTARLLRINFLLLLLVVTRVHGRNSKNMALEEVNSNTEFGKILGNSSR